MLSHLRALKASFAGPMAALLALGFLVANPGVSAAWEAGDAVSLTTPQTQIHTSTPIRTGPDGAHAADSKTHAGHHGSEEAPLGHGSDHHDADHGCEGCFCVAAAGCAAPAVPPPNESVTSTPPSHHVHLARAEPVPGRLLHQDIFRPPRAT